MEIKKSITINLTPADVKQIILDYLTKDGYVIKTENDISFQVGTECQGYGMAEREVTIFKGCSVNCKEKQH